MSNKNIKKEESKEEYSKLLNKEFIDKRIEQSADSGRLTIEQLLKFQYHIDKTIMTLNLVGKPMEIVEKFTNVDWVYFVYKDGRKIEGVSVPVIITKIGWYFGDTLEKYRIIFGEEKYDKKEFMKIDEMSINDKFKFVKKEFPEIYKFNIEDGKYFLLSISGFSKYLREGDKFEWDTWRD